ncbi:unnamed protein product, partial [Owenia fusiformis]
FNMASGNEDVPPLEDMSELLQKVEAIRDMKGISKKDTPKSNEPSRAAKQTAKNASPEHKLPTSTPSPSLPSNQDNKDSAFAGMKKGFLFGAPASKSKQESKPKPTAKPVNKKTDPINVQEEIPFIKANKEEENTRLSMPEVQDAMKASQNLMNNKEWITQDFLQTIQSRPKLLEKLTNPVFQQAISDFQTNPEAATMKYKDNTEVFEFFKEFSGILGQHFSELGEREQSEQPAEPPSGADMKVHSSTNPNQATAEDEARIQKILADPEIKGAIMDKTVQQLIYTLKNDPHQAQVILQNATPDIQGKIKKLVDVGLLAFQR